MEKDIEFARSVDLDNKKRIASLEQDAVSVAAARQQEQDAWSQHRDTLTQDNADLDTKISQLRNELHQMELDRDKLNHELEGLRSASTGDISSLQERVTSLQAKLRDGDKERADLSAQVATLTAGLAEWRSTAEERGDAIADLARQLNESTDEAKRCEAKLMSEQARTADLDRQMANMRQRLSALEVLNAENDEQRGALSAKLERSQTMLAMAQGELNQLQAKVSQLEKSGAASEQSLAECRKKLTDAEKRCEGCDAEKRALGAKVQELESEIARREAVSKAEADRHAFKSQTHLDELQSKASSIAELQQQVDAERAAKAQLAGQLKTVSSLLFFLTLSAVSLTHCYDRRKVVFLAVTLNLRMQISKWLLCKQL